MYRHNKKKTLQLTADLSEIATISLVVFGNYANFHFPNFIFTFF